MDGDGSGTGTFEDDMGNLRIGTVQFREEFREGFGSVRLDVIFEANSATEYSLDIDRSSIRTRGEVDRFARLFPLDAAGEMLPAIFDEAPESAIDSPALSGVLLPGRYALQTS